MTDTSTTTTGTDWHAWQESRDRAAGVVHARPRGTLPDHARWGSPHALKAMREVEEAVVGPTPRVLDLACGTGSITARLFTRFPGRQHRRRPRPGAARPPRGLLRGRHTGLPINAAERAQRHARMDRAKADGALDWSEWWQPAAKDPVLAAPTARRYEVYGEHADGGMPSVEWHARACCARRGSRRRGRCGARPPAPCCSP